MLADEKIIEKKRGVGMYVIKGARKLFKVMKLPDAESILTLMKNTFSFVKNKLGL